ncbi:unnamed protein product [Victoria cruziana]
MPDVEVRATNAIQPQFGPQSGSI